MHYIRNTKTDCSFDPIEDKFFSNRWTPEFEDDPEYLRDIINSDQDRFKDCVIEALK